MNLLQELEWLRNNRSVNFFTASEGDPPHVVAAHPEHGLGGNRQDKRIHSGTDGRSLGVYSIPGRFLNIAFRIS